MDNGWPDQSKLWEHNQLKNVDIFAPAWPWFTHTLRALRPILRPGARVLTVGIGDGSQGSRLDMAGYSAHVLDLCPKSIDVYATKFPTVHFVCGDICRPPYAPGSFDAVILSHVIEHIENDDAALFRAWGILKRGGVCIVQVPAEEVMARRMAYCPHGAEFHVDGHCHSYTREDLESLMRVCFASVRVTRHVYRGPGMNILGEITTFLRDIRAKWRPVDGAFLFGIGRKAD